MNDETNPDRLLDEIRRVFNLGYPISLESNVGSVDEYVRVEVVRRVYDAATHTGTKLVLESAEGETLVEALQQLLFQARENNNG